MWNPSYKKNSGLFWSWPILTNWARWFKHYSMVWVQRKGNMQGPTRHLSPVRAREHLFHNHQTTKYLFQMLEERVFSKANFQPVFENFIPKRWETYIFILFRISTVHSWFSSLRGKPWDHLWALFLIFHLSFIYLAEFDKKSQAHNVSPLAG